MKIIYSRLARVYSLNIYSRLARIYSLKNPNITSLLYILLWWTIRSQHIDTTNKKKLYIICWSEHFVVSCTIFNLGIQVQRMKVAVGRTCPPPASLGSSEVVLQPLTPAGSVSLAAKPNHPASPHQVCLVSSISSIG